MSSCISSTRSCGSFTSSSGCGETRHPWRWAKWDISGKQGERTERAMRQLRVLGAAVVGATALLVARPAAAQYFGQNKVQYRSFPFKVIQTEHFEVYFYDEERAAALDAARMAERAYARLSRVLHHKFQARKPIILYASH